MTWIGKASASISELYYYFLYLILCTKNEKRNRVEQENVFLKIFSSLNHKLNLQSSSRQFTQACPQQQTDINSLTMAHRHPPHNSNKRWIFLHQRIMLAHRKRLKMCWKDLVRTTGFFSPNTEFVPTMFKKTTQKFAILGPSYSILTGRNYTAKVKLSLPTFLWKIIGLTIWKVSLK